MKAFDTVNMASGGIALVLEPQATWEDFSDYANKWAEKLKAKKTSKPLISFDECLLEVKIDGGRFWITYDDFQSSIQLEPKNKRYNEIIYAIQKQFRENT